MTTEKRMMIGVIIAGICIWAGWALLKKEPAQVHVEQVVVTFFPFYDIASEIGGNHVHVRQIVPDGAEPHDYEPSADDIVNVLSADVVIMNGGGVDAWAEKLIPDIEQAGGTVVRMSDVVPFLTEENDKEHIDPHAWLDVPRMENMSQAIADALIAKDQEHAEDYTVQANEVQEKLKMLDRQFTETLATCAQRAVVVTHNAFRYWELSYTIDVLGISGTAEAEPSVRDIARITSLAKEQGITTIFFASSEGAALAEAIAHELHIQTQALSPLEGRTAYEVTQHATYFTIMNDNLHALAQALTCTQ